MAVEKWATPMAACARCDSQAGAPISSVMALAMSPKRFWYSATMRSSTAPRSSREVCDQGIKARRAASTARSTSAAEPMAILPQGSSVAGLITSSGWTPSAGSTQAPSMKNCRWSRMVASPKSCCRHPS